MLSNGEQDIPNRTIGHDESKIPSWAIDTCGDSTPLDTRRFGREHWEGSNMNWCNANSQYRERVRRFVKSKEIQALLPHHVGEAIRRIAELQVPYVDYREVQGWGSDGQRLAEKHTQTVGIDSLSDRELRELLGVKELPREKARRILGQMRSSSIRGLDGRLQVRSLRKRRPRR